jgi:hypothetical protein
MLKLVRIGETSIAPWWLPATGFAAIGVTTILTQGGFKIGKSASKALGN